MCWLKYIWSWSMWIDTPNISKTCRTPLVTVRQDQWKRGSKQWTQPWKLRHLRNRQRILSSSGRGWDFGGWDMSSFYRQLTIINIIICICIPILHVTVIRQVLTRCRQCSHFCGLLPLSAAEYRQYSKKQQHFIWRISDLDPVTVIRQVLTRCRQCLHLSGLLPLSAAEYRQYSQLQRLQVDADASTWDKHLEAINSIEFLWFLSSILVASIMLLDSQKPAMVADFGMIPPSAMTYSDVARGSVEDLVLSKNGVLPKNHDLSSLFLLIHGHKLKVKR